MVKIDETYFYDNLEEDLQEPAPVATDESATEPQPRLLLGDLLDEEAEAEPSGQDETDTLSDAVTYAADQTDSVTESDPTGLESKTKPLEEPDTLGEQEVDMNDEFSAESDQSTCKRSSRGLWYWLGGDMLEQPAFRKYIPAFIAILLMGLIHVTSNYQIISKRRQIDKLETQVRDLTYKHMESVSELTRRSIGGNFEQQLQAMGSDLEAPSQQSIILYRDAKK